MLDKRIPPLWESRPEEFPLAGEVLSLATGLVVHSRYVEERVRAAGFAGPVGVVPHPAWPDPDPTPGRGRRRSAGRGFGSVNQSKRVPQLLEAFARLRTTRPGARLLLVGATSPGFDLDRRLQRLGLDDTGSSSEGYVDEGRLWSLMAACDVHTSLRSPTMGETSGTAIRALVLGKPLVVSDVGWFSELPGDVALKVAVGEAEAAVSRRGPRAPRGAAGRAERDGRGGARARADGTRPRSGRGAPGGGIRARRGRGCSGRRGGARGERRRASIGVAPGSPEASEIARRLSELELGG